MRSMALGILRVRLKDPTRIMSLQEIHKELLEALECESEFELINTILTMSESLDKLAEAVDHIDEITHRAGKVRDLIPEEAK